MLALAVIFTDVVDNVDRRATAKGGVGSARIVEVDEDRQRVESFLVRAIRPSVCPLVEQGLDESLGFAIDLRPI